MPQMENSHVPLGRLLGCIPRRMTVSRVLVLIMTMGACTYAWYIYVAFSDWDEQDPAPEYAAGLDALSLASGRETAYDNDDGFGFLPLMQADEMCKKYGMKPYPYRDRHRKVYDLFLVGTELDWTEIRLHELSPNVDYFVILEADTTFTNATKPMYFRDNWHHFEKFASQIIYHALNDEAIRDNGLTWDREKYQRNALITQVFPSLLGDKAPNLGDVIIISDVDEIIRPDTVDVLRNCDFPARTGIQSRFFLYSFQWHRSDWDWFHPQVTYWQNERTILPESLRMERTSYQFQNAAWHCTTCFGTLAEYINKIESFSHVEMNVPEYKDPDTIIARIQNGTDLFDRGFPYEKIPQHELDAPEYLLQNRKRFKYLLDRDGPNAGFGDHIDGYDRNGTVAYRVPQLPKAWQS